MAVTPLVPPALVPQPAAALPVAADPAVRVTPPTASAHGGSTDTATSDQSAWQKLPLEKAIDEINAQMKAWSTQLQFEIDPDVHQVVVSVVDAQSGNIIRTIPSETLLKIAKMIVNMQGNGIKTTA